MPPAKTLPIICPRCQAPMRRGRTEFRCSSGHVIVILDGVADFAPAELPGSTGHIFDTPYGVIYDEGVRHPTVASWVARLMWGSDLSTMYSLMDRGLTAAPGSVVLDVPVGGAPVLQRAARLRCTYIGADLSLSMLQRASAQAEAKGFDKVTLIRADATDLPIRDASVDRVLCFNGLHVIPEKGCVIAEAARVLRRGGQFWATTITTPPDLLGKLIRPWTIRGGYLLHPAREDELRAAGEIAGFRQWRQERQGALVTIRAVR